MHHAFALALARISHLASRHSALRTPHSALRTPHPAISIESSIIFHLHTVTTSPLTSPPGKQPGEHDLFTRAVLGGCHPQRVPRARRRGCGALKEEHRSRGAEAAVVAQLKPRCKSCQRSVTQHGRRSAGRTTRATRVAHSARCHRCPGTRTANCHTQHAQHLSHSLKIDAAARHENAYRRGARCKSGVCVSK